GGTRGGGSGWFGVRTSGPSRGSWATPPFRRPRSIHGSPPSACGRSTTKLIRAPRLGNAGSLSPMPGDATQSDLRASLEEERSSLRAQLAELGFGENGGLDYDQNFADSSQVTAERGEAEALAKSLRETLSGVEHALAKFEAGTYGTCEDCGQPI